MSEPEEPPLEPIFTVLSTHCGEIMLSPRRWIHACERHSEISPFLEQIKQTLESPGLIYETAHTRPTYAFYKRELLLDVPRFSDCYVAVYVRYTMQPAQVWTAYLPRRLSANPGRLVHIER